MAKGKGGGSAPKAPDAYETAKSESQFNRLDTYSPSGSGTRYGYTDANGVFQQGVAPKGYQSAVQTIESPWEKQIREALQPASVALTDRVITDNVTNMPDAARPKDTSQLANDIFSAGYARMKPGFEAENDRLLQNLQDRGLPIGSDAFNTTYAQQQQSVNDALRELTLGATREASNEQSRQFALDSSARSNSIAELVAAMGGSYNPPSAVPSGSASPVNYSANVQNQYNAQQQAYQAKQANAASTAGTLGSIGGAMLLKCSMEVKDLIGFADTSDVAEAVLEMPVAVWRYKPGEAPPGLEDASHIGPMAEHFRAATGLGDGKSIPVVDMVGVLMGALQNALRRIEVLERNQRGARVH